jgi:uncharacterized protein DUF3800
LPRSGSRVRIPSPAPIFSRNIEAPLRPPAWVSLCTTKLARISVVWIRCLNRATNQGDLISRRHARRCKGIVMWFVYLDESKEDNKFYVYSALIVNSEKWNEAFKALKDARARLRDRRGIFIKQELHAWKFTAGKGQIAKRKIDKVERAEIFRRVLSFAAEAGFFRIISSVNTNEFYAFDRIMNRINRTAAAEKQHVILICDKGQEVEFTHRMRRMRVHNPVRSRFGQWQLGSQTKNIPTAQILEDPFLKTLKIPISFKLWTFARMRCCAWSGRFRVVPHSATTRCMRSCALS